MEERFLAETLDLKEAGNRLGKSSLSQTCKKNTPCLKAVMASLQCLTGDLAQCCDQDEPTCLLLTFTHSTGLRFTL
jgi:hypothetical protein